MTFRAGGDHQGSLPVFQEALDLTQQRLARAAVRTPPCVERAAALTSNIHRTGKRIRNQGADTKNGNQHTQI